MMATITEHRIAPLSAGDNLPRFVVLRHDLPCDSERQLHWDFMLEAGDVLRTWALAIEPMADSMGCFAERLPDHRLLYLDYEGEVPRGRGTVSRLDAGSYSPIEESEQRLVIKLSGALLCGTATLARCEGEDQRWRFSFASEGTAASGFSRASDAGDSGKVRGTV